MVVGWAFLRRLNVALTRRALATAVCGAALSSASLARADGYELERTSPLPMSLGMGTAAVLATGAFLLPSPLACRWCSPTAFDEALHAPVAPESRRQIASVSHVISFGVLPLGGIAAGLLPPLLAEGPEDHASENLVMFGEAMLVNVALTIAVKKWVGRRRPAFHYRRSAFTEFSQVKREAYLSFFSGDTSMAFVAASASTTISYLRGYSVAPYVAVSSGVLATTTALMRVGADVHWPTDVITGAVVGASVGILVPLLLHPRVDETRPRSAPQTSQQPALTLPLFQVSGGF